MNKQHLSSLCTELQLGSPLNEPSQIHGSRGGSLIWRVNTEKSSYAIKQLAPIINLKNENIVSKYELSETIASRFQQQGIATVSAREKLGKHLFIIENTGYLVYPWVEGYILAQDKISEPHAMKMAEIIAKLHAINLDVPEIKSPHVDMHARDRILEAIDKSAFFNSTFVKTLRENQSLILDLNEEYLSVIPILLEDTVISHGDLNQLNVLWDKADQAILIDWESARKLNPTRDIIRASLSWSGFHSKDFSLPIYTSMLQTYTNAGGKLNPNHIPAAFYSAIGSMINWMLYNIEIACTDDATEAKDTAIKEINDVMKTMKKFKTSAPDLIKLSLETTN